MKPPSIPSTFLAQALRAAVACLLAAGVSGCVFPAMGPNYKRPAVALPTAYRVDSAEAADVTNTAWWKAFRDPDLDDLINHALLANSDILIAAARVQEFDAKLESTNSQYFPQLGYDVGYEHNLRSEEVPEILRPGQPAGYNQYKFEGTISYEMDLWGRVRRSYEASRAELLTTAEARHTVMLTVVTTVATTYIQLLEQDRELEIAKQTLSSLQSSLTLTDQKFKGGSATDIEVAQARADFEDQAAVIPDLEHSIASLEDNLSTLIGFNPGPIKRGRIDKLVLTQVPGGVPADVLTRRPDVIAAEQTLVASNARIGIAKTEYFPTFALTSSYGQSSDLTRWLLAKTAHTGLLDIDFIGPIFSFGRIQGDVRKARAIVKEDTERYLQTIQTALKEVDVSLVYNEKSRMRLAAFDRRVAALQNADRLSQARYQGGSFTQLDVFDADRKLYQGQNEQVQGVRDQYLALVSVYKAMGGGWMVDQDKHMASIKTPTATKDVTLK